VTVNLRLLPVEADVDVVASGQANHRACHFGSDPLVQTALIGETHPTTL